MFSTYQNKTGQVWDTNIYFNRKGLQSTIYLHLYCLLKVLKLKLKGRKLSLVDQRFRSLHLRAKIIIIEIIEKMTDFDRNVSELVNDVNYSAKNPVLKLGIRFLFPIWFGMMAYIVWALVGAFIFTHLLSGRLIQAPDSYNHELNLKNDLSLDSCHILIV